MLSWNLHWSTASRACLGAFAQNSACRELRAIATDTQSRLQKFRELKLSPESTTRSTARNDSEAHQLLPALLRAALPSAAAASSCEWTDAPDRLRRGGGSSTEFEFGAHLGPGAFDELLGRLLATETTPAQAQTLVREFLAQHSRTLEREKQNAARIVALSASVNRQGRTQEIWLGVEASPEEVSAQAIDQIRNDANTYSELMATLGIPRQQIDDSLLLAFGPAVSHVVRRPSEESRVRLVGVESSSLRVQSSEIHRRLLQMLFEDMYRLFMEQKISREFVVAITSLRQTCLAENRAPNESERQAVLALTTTDAGRDLATEYMSHVGRFIALSAQRDREAAQNIWSQTGVGLVMMGGRHEQGIRAHLTALCQAAPPRGRTGGAQQ